VFFQAKYVSLSFLLFAICGEAHPRRQCGADVAQWPSFVKTHSRFFSIFYYFFSFFFFLHSMSASAAARLVIRTFPAQLPRAPAATQPSFVHGRWRKPAISARRRADLRKGGALAAVDGLGTTELGAEAATAFATAEDLRIVAGAGRPQREFKRPAGVRKQEARCV
jgi:hypothetical protein